MNGGTELDVTALDEHTVATTEPQGEIYLHLQNLPSGQTYTITTPRGIVTLDKDGRYDIVAGDTENPTMITVLEGSAEVAATNLSLQVAANQTATINGTETFQGSVGALQQDAFLASMAAREQQQAAALQSSGAPPAVVQGMTGSQTLSRYGTWQSNQEYGSVWYPNVGAGWSPYEDGSWQYAEPWGWTWVSAEPWGFAPFHYGRWAELDGRWAWVPAAYAQGSGYALPVYAPALVAFFGLAGGRVGWVPLAPGEAFLPPFRARERYLRALNRFDVRNFAQLRRELLVLDRLANRRAGLVVPAAVVTGSRPVRDAARRLGDAGPVGAHPLMGNERLRPTLATAGVTRRVARELGLRGEARRIALAPGPRVEARAFGRPGERRLPALRQANIPFREPAAEQRREAGAAERHPPGVAPAEGLPALRAPDDRPGAPAALLGPRGREAIPGARGHRALVTGLRDGPRREALIGPGAGARHRAGMPPAAFRPEPFAGRRAAPNQRFRAPIAARQPAMRFGAPAMGRFAPAAPRFAPRAVGPRFAPPAAFRFAQPRARFAAPGPRFFSPAPRFAAPAMRMGGPPARMAMPRVGPIGRGFGRGF